jgi:hypothetical protein
MCNIAKKCDNCGKLSECTTTCEFPSDNSSIELCPQCLKDDGSFCLSCGQFCSGIESFDFIHPGYCDTCWDEIESETGWGEEENEWDDDDEEFPHDSLDY